MGEGPERVGHRDDVGPRIPAAGGARQRRLELRGGGLLDGPDERCPIAHPLVQRRRPDSHLGGDRLHRERVETAGLEEAGRSVDDRLVGRPGAGGTHVAEDRLLTLALQGYMM